MYIMYGMKPVARFFNELKFTISNRPMCPVGVFVVDPQSVAEILQNDGLIACLEFLAILNNFSVI
jgi:hypothetical protein